MSKNLTQEILVVSGNNVAPTSSNFRSLGQTDHLVNSIKIEILHSEINSFLSQMNIVFQDTPREVGGFKLDEIEVAASLVLQGQGELKIALLGGLQVGAEASAGLRFVFKRN